MVWQVLFAAFVGSLGGSLLGNHLRRASSAVQGAAEQIAEHFGPKDDDLGDAEVDDPDDPDTDKKRVTHRRFW